MGYFSNINFTLCILGKELLFDIQLKKGLPEGSCSIDNFVTFDECMHIILVVLSDILNTDNPYYYIYGLTGWDFGKFTCLCARFRNFCEENPKMTVTYDRAYFYEKLESPAVIMPSIKYTDRCDASIPVNQLLW